MVCASWSDVPRALALALTAALLCAAPAAAAHAAPPAPVAVPAGAPVVAGPTASGAVLIGFVHGAKLCVVVQRAGEPRPERVAQPDDCAPVPVLAPLGHSELGEQYDRRGTHQAFGVTGSDVAAVEARRSGRTVAHAATAPSPLPGAAAELRFYLLETGDRTPADELALLDASGDVRRAYETFDAPPDDDAAATPLAARSVVLAHGRRGAETWTLRSRIRRLLASTPLEPERRVSVACLTFSHGARAGSGGSWDTCDQPGSELLILPGPSVDCAPIGLSVTVLARAAVRRAVLVLGDGTRRAIALRAIPGAAAGLRAGVAVLGTGVAVRRVAAMGARGRALSNVSLDQAPAPARTSCLGSSSDIYLFGPSGTSRLAGPGPHGLRAVDDGAQICIAADRAPRVPGDCRLPPIDAERAWVRRWVTAGGRFVAGIVPAEVAAARLALDDGTTRDVAAVPIPGYTGRYAGVVRSVSLDVPGPQRVVGFALLDARGRVLTRDWGSPERPAAQHVATVLRRPGLPPLRTALVPRIGTLGPTICLQLGRAAPTASSCQGAAPRQFTVLAQCAPRRIVIYGVLGHRGDRMAVRVAGGGEIAARTAPLPAAVRPGALAALAVLPASAAPRAVVVRGRATGHADLVLPPAARQCGYSDEAFVSDRPDGWAATASPLPAG